jgi:hypothetical protein
VGRTRCLCMSRGRGACEEEGSCRVWMAGREYWAGRGGPRTYAEAADLAWDYWILRFEQECDSWGVVQGDTIWKHGMMDDTVAREYTNNQMLINYLNKVFLLLIHAGLNANQVYCRPLTWLISMYCTYYVFKYIRYFKFVKQIYLDIF